MQYYISLDFFTSLLKGPMIYGIIIGNYFITILSILSPSMKHTI